jgi:hypothetical protein
VVQHPVPNLVPSRNAVLEYLVHRGELEAVEPDELGHQAHLVVAARHDGSSQIYRLREFAIHESDGAPFRQERRPKHNHLVTKRA